MIKVSESKDDSHKIYCIDSLKQIVTKYLIRKDTLEAKSQPLILTPFLDLSNTINFSLDYLLGCIF